MCVCVCECVCVCMRRVVGGERESGWLPGKAGPSAQSWEGAAEKAECAKERGSHATGRWELNGEAGGAKQRR